MRENSLSQSCVCWDLVYWELLVLILSVLGSNQPSLTDLCVHSYFPSHLHLHLLLTYLPIHSATIPICLQNFSTILVHPQCLLGFSLFLFRPLSGQDCTNNTCINLFLCHFSDKTVLATCPTLPLIFTLELIIVAIFKAPESFQKVQSCVL